MELTHFDEHGNARMVDVSEKDITSRSACAVGSILVNEEILHKIEQSDMKKGWVGLASSQNTSPSSALSRR